MPPMPAADEIGRDVKGRPTPFDAPAWANFNFKIRVAGASFIHVGVLPMPIIGWRKAHEGAPGAARPFGAFDYHSARIAWACAGGATLPRAAPPHAAPPSPRRLCHHEWLDARQKRVDFHEHER